MSELLLAASETLGTRVQIFAIVGSALLFLFVFELLRRRRLSEPYAILWLLASVVLLVLSVWDDLLETLADAVGHRHPRQRAVRGRRSASSSCCC